MHKAQLDKVGYFMIAIGIIANLPQIYQIFFTHSAEDISLLSWCAYAGINAFWLWFAIERKIKILAYSAIAGLFVKAIMIYGIYLYGTVDFSFT